MNTNGAIITNAGLELISHALANNKNISFTKTKLGKGDVNSFDEAKKLNDIIQFYKEIPITSIARNNSGIVRIRSSFTNADFPHEVILKEVGIFAKTDETSEILFAYVNDGLGENFPPGNSGNVIERTRDIYVGVGSTVQVNAIIDKSVVYATVYDLEEGLNKKEDKFSKNSGFNKVKTDIVENDTNKIFTALGALNLKNCLVSNYTTLMNNIRGTLETAIGTKLAHGGYGGTGQTLFNLIESAKTSLTSLINGKENSFSKNSGWNLEKTDLTENNSNKLFTAKGALNLLNNLTSKFAEGINSAKTTLRSEMLNIKNSLSTLIGNKLSHGGYSGTGQDLKNSIDRKQDINDNTLQTKSKVVAGAINELNKVKIDNSSIVNDLTTGGTNKVLSAEQGKNLDIYVKNKNTVKIKDDRTRNPKPSEYESYNTTMTFNNHDGPFNGDWASIMTVKGWGDGYSAWQFAGYASTYTPNFKGLWMREAVSADRWGDWYRLWTSKEFDPVTKFNYTDMFTTIPKNFNGATQVPSNSPEVAPLIAGSQHFVIQQTTSLDDPNNAYTSQIATNYGTDPRMMIRSTYPGGASPWVEVITKNHLPGISQKSELLWSGAVNSVGHVMTLSKSMTEFDLIFVGGNWTGTGTAMTTCCFTNDMIASVGQVSMCGLRKYLLGKQSNNQIRINQSWDGDPGADKILKVYGVKFQW